MRFLLPQTYIPLFSYFLFLVCIFYSPYLFLRDVQEGLCITGFNHRISMESLSQHVRTCHIRSVITWMVLAVIIFAPERAYTQEEVLADTLKKLSLEELFNVEVTSVSRRQEKLSEVASAIQVITREDIRRSAATSIPEALRLATNLQTAQINSNAWIIGARGFNSAFPNKLLVMIDGRTVYSPLFAGVFWDALSVVLEDIERIEVISGPGGTLWGANAVNGVINIITKKASDSQGLYAAVAAGSYMRDHEVIRYGGKIGDNLSYRIYAQHHHRKNTYMPTNEDQDYTDDWYLAQTGFRLDWNASEKDNVMVQGNYYDGKQYTAVEPSYVDGQNILALWSHNFSETSELIVQAYFDRTWRRDTPSTFSDQLYTTDLDFQHGFSIGKRNRFLWGGGYRRMDNHILHATIFAGFLPPRRSMDLYSAFVQDEIELVPEALQFTIGTKLQHNFFSGFEIQPSARLAWTPNQHHTVWSAVSRAVRAPSRIDSDLFYPTFEVPPGTPHVAGGPDFVSEKVIAYELGYRFTPVGNFSVSVASFYNVYDDLYTVEAQEDGTTYQTENGARGTSYGLELSGTWQLLPRWRIRGGYTFFRKDLETKPGHTYNVAALGYDAQDHGLIQSMLNLPWNLQFDFTTRYVGPLDDYQPDYFSADARLAWVTKNIEISLNGQNLWEEKHTEFIYVIPRSVYGKVVVRF